MIHKDICFSCEKEPKSILELVCYHKLCLSCASTLIEFSSVDENLIVCDICHKKTYLNRDVIKEIIKEKQLKEKQTKDIKLKLLSNSSNEIFNLKKENDSHCLMHPEYALMYICHTCHENLICPECAIHGVHHSHTVTSLNQHSQQITRSLKIEIDRINDRLSLLDELIKNRMQQIMERRRDVESLRVSAVRRFESIRSHIAAEERVIMIKCEELLEGYTLEEEQTKDHVERQINLFKDMKGEVNSILEYNQVKKDIVLFVEKYKAYYKNKYTSEYYVETINRNQDSQEEIDALSNRIEEINLANLSKSESKNIVKQKKEIKQPKETNYDKEFEIKKGTQLHHFEEEKFIKQNQYREEELSNGTQEIRQNVKERNANIHKKNSNNKEKIKYFQLL